MEAVKTYPSQLQGSRCSGSCTPWRTSRPAPRPPGTCRVWQSVPCLPDSCLLAMDYLSKTELPSLVLGHLGNSQSEITPILGCLMYYKKYYKFPLTPMGVLAPRSAHARHSAQPPIDVSGNFLSRVY